MYSDKAYNLTPEEYNYLLPVMRKNLLNVECEKFSFIGSPGELNDALLRLKGLYDCYDLDVSYLSYKCFINTSLIPFREKIKS